MTTPGRLGTLTALLSLLTALAGCAGRARVTCDPAGDVPPVPLTTSPDRDQGGMFLRTGAFKLGPNVGEDLFRPQGDGNWGAWSLSAGARRRATVTEEEAGEPAQPTAGARGGALMPGAGSGGGSTGMESFAGAGGGI